MKTSLQMFIRRHGKVGHEDIRVHVDWEGANDEDIKLMAAYYILNRAAHDLKGYDRGLPESVTYRAADFVHSEPLVQKEYVVPKSWKAPYKSRARKELEELLRGLSPEERATLLS